MKKLKVIVLCLMLLIVSVGVIFFSKYKTNYLHLINNECENYKLNQNLILAVIKTESGFDEKSLSKAGAMGLMQILPSTAMWIAQQLNDGEFKTEDLFVPSKNIKFGCYYLRYLLDYYNQNEQLAICAYNAGMGVVNNWISDENYFVDGKLKNIPYKETRNYLKKINFNKKIYALFIIK